MTAYQFATLKYIIQHDSDVKLAGKFSMVTFGSLAQRGWIQRRGSLIELTEAGFEEFNKYNKGQANFRKYDTGLSDRVRSLLHLHATKIKNIA